MNIEDMIEYIGEHTTNSEVTAQIIAALKAGQAMYNGYTILERQGRQCGFLDSTEHGKLLTAWDAATKEESMSIDEMIRVLEGEEEDLWPGDPSN